MDVVQRIEVIKACEFEREKMQGFVYSINERYDLPNVELGWKYCECMKLCGYCEAVIMSLIVLYDNK